LSYFLYILQSISTERYYIGISNDYLRRLEFHNTIEKGYTARYRPWKVVFVKEYPNRQLAHKAELKLKAWKSRVMIERVISGEIKV
jgi:predicted GIY-YIG superfamily endonuclease